MEMSLLFAGFCGGVIRGLVGYLKYQFSYKNVKFQWQYFLLMVGISGVIGVSAGWLIRGVLVEGETINAFYAFLAGYAGGDFIENAFKIIVKKPSLFKLPEIIKASKI
jgi:hypothetical protein